MNVYKAFIGRHSVAVYMERQNEEFWHAYATIMNEIDNRPGTRPLFHALLNLALKIMEEEDAQ